MSGTRAATVLKWPGSFLTVPSTRKITEEHLEHISCICHKTKFENLRSIFTIGLAPGGISSANDRAHINFTPFPPFDSRNMAPARPGKELNAAIVFKPKAMLRYNIGLSLNAIVVTSCNIPWTTIELVYVVPPVHSGELWVLYNPDLIDRKIQGHTSPNNDKMSIPLWPNRKCLRTQVTRIVVGGSVPI